MDIVKPFTATHSTSEKDKLIDRSRFHFKPKQGMQLLHTGECSAEAGGHCTGKIHPNLQHQKRAVILTDVTKAYFYTGQNIDFGARHWARKMRTELKSIPAVYFLNYPEKALLAVSHLNGQLMIQPKASSPQSSDLTPDLAAIHSIFINSNLPQKGRTGDIWLKI